MADRVALLLEAIRAARDVARSTATVQRVRIGPNGTWRASSRERGSSEAGAGRLHQALNAVVHRCALRQGDETADEILRLLMAEFRVPSGDDGPAPRELGGET